MSWLQRFFAWVRTIVRGRPSLIIPREPVSLRPIGVVRNDIAEPRPDGWEQVRSDIILREDLMPMLDGIEGYSHLIIIFAFDRVPETERRVRVRPRGDPAIPEQGVLATRSQLRPNPIGVSVVRQLRRRRNIVWVQGLDAVNGTPVLDIKPYFPNYDAVPDAGIPEWAAKLAR